MAGQIEDRLSGGHPNSLGQTVAVAQDVLGDPTQVLMDELCAAYGSEDEVVRLRVSSALKRICGLHRDSLDADVTPRPEWIRQRFSWLVHEIGWGLDQPSAKWSIAQMVQHLDDRLTDEQRAEAVALLRHNLIHEDDWIVKNTTMEALVALVLDHPDDELHTWLGAQLSRNAEDPRKSVAAKATRLAAVLRTG